MQKLYAQGRALWQHRIMKALSVGVLAVGVQTIVFEIVGVFLRLTPLSTATVIGAEFGILTNFILNNMISFKDKTGGRAVYRFVRLHLVVSGSVAIQWGSLFVAERLTQNFFILHGIYVVSIIIGFVWNYTWYTIWVWRHPTEDAVPL